MAAESGSGRRMAVVWEALEGHARALAGLAGFPTWSEAGRWRSIPADRSEVGVLPHDGSWMVGDLPAILWLVSGLADSPDALVAAARRWSDRLESRLGVRSFASTSHLFFRGAALGGYLSGDARLSQMAARAGAVSLQRLRACGYMKSFGTAEDTAYPFTTIDDVINLVLPMWSAREVGDAAGVEQCLSAIRTIEEWLVREDGSTGQVLFFDGRRPKAVGTYQGRAADTCWSRGLAWGIYGFSVAARASGERSFTEAALRMAEYWMANVRDDPAPPWDFAAGEVSPQVRDSFAAALGYAGILDLCDGLGDDPRREPLLGYAEQMVAGLWDCYGAGNPPGGGILRSAALDVPHQHGVQCSVIVGDSYFTECIWRLAGGNRLWPGAPR